MLPASSRVRSRSEHRLVAARGRRARRGPLVVHVLVGDGGAGEPARAGVVAGKRVGGAVERNLVKRRVRELLRERLAEQPPGSLIVVRALPGAAQTGFVALGRALDGALPKATERMLPTPASAVQR